MLARIAAICLYSLISLNGSAQQQQSSAPQDITYCELAANPTRFAGKEVRVKAIYRYMFEVQSLESPVCCPRSEGKIWGEISPDLEGRSLELFKRFPEGMGLVLGVFVGTIRTGDAYGDGSYRSELLVNRIQELIHISKSPRQQDNPAWAPANCKGALTHRSGL